MKTACGLKYAECGFYKAKYKYIFFSNLRNSLILKVAIKFIFCFPFNLKFKLSFTNNFGFFKLS